MKNWTIQYKCGGELHQVICFKNMYAASIIKALRSRKGVSDIVVLDLKDDNYMSPQDVEALANFKNFSAVSE